jgi:hypothetical protein
MSLRFSALCLILPPLLHTGAAAAQGLPAWRPLNPVVASRSALGFFPVRDRHPGWLGEVRIDYGNAIERQTRTNAAYLFDGELIRLELSAGRNFGRWSLLGGFSVKSFQSGALDPLIQRFHDWVGSHEINREARPQNEFSYSVELPNGTRMEYPLGTEISDVRLGAEYRPFGALQLTGIVALPTNTLPQGLGLDRPAFGLTATARVPLGTDRMIWESSGGIGYTPAGGLLARFQRESFTSASTGLRWRFLGQQAMYASLWYHSAAWQGTTLPGYDMPDVSVDVGFLPRIGEGPQFLLGVMEDLFVQGPALDVVFRIGAHW